jgi:hypothetical protein
MLRTLFVFLLFTIGAGTPRLHRGTTKFGRHQGPRKVGCHYVHDFQHALNHVFRIHCYDRHQLQCLQHQLPTRFRQR